jgi:hypothetical protein
MMAFGCPLRLRDMPGLLLRLVLADWRARR